MSDDAYDADIPVIIETAKALYGVLAGKSPQVMGAVLAEAVARWLSGHIFLGADGALATKEMREKMLDSHVETVRAIIPIAAKELGLPW